MAQLAFLGAGLIGKNLALAAAARGDTVTLWNRTAARATAAAAEDPRITAVATVADAVAGADRIHMALSDDDATNNVLEMVIPALKARTNGGEDVIVVDHTTTAPVPTAARAARCLDAGIAFLHAPVFMSPAGCRAAQGVMLVAGSDALFSQVKDDLARMTGTLRFVGTRTDLAASWKLFGNAALLSLVGVVADIFAVADGAGLTPAQALEVFEVFQPTGAIAVRGPKMAAGDFSPSFELTMARKDLRLMLETAGERPLSVLPGLAARMDALIARGHGGDDVGVLATDVVKAT